MTKQLVAALSCAMLMAACGGSGDQKASETKDSTATATPAAPAPAASNAASDKALDLIAASDCTTCHKLHKGDAGAILGPTYSDVAAKYRPAADTTITRLVNKVISGGSGIWGTTPMTPHPALKPEDVRTMVTYILSLKD